MKRLVRIVQGSLVKDAGCRPRRTVRSGSREVNTNKITLTATKNHNALRLKPRRLSSDNTVRNYSTCCTVPVNLLRSRSINILMYMDNSQLRLLEDYEKSMRFEDNLKFYKAPLS